MLNFFVLITPIDPVTRLDAFHGSRSIRSDPLSHHLVSTWVALRNYPAMALVDFYQLALLYNLSRYNGGTIFNCTYPPPMPATGRPTSSSSALEPNLAGSSTFPLVGSAPKTPKNKHHADLSIQESTPTSRGTSILPRLEPDTDEPRKYGAIKYEQYIAQDFERHRVFVDIDVFMENVLHVPTNWKELWGPTIETIKLDKGFSRACTLYTSECEQGNGGETRFYKPLVDMGNAILRVSGSSNNELIKPKTPQRYLRNDPKKILGGVMNDLSPDIVAVHGELLPHLSRKERKGRHLNETNLNWAQPLHVLEVKPWGGALVDGSSMPRLKVNGKCSMDSRSDRAATDRKQDGTHTHHCSPQRKGQSPRSPTTNYT